MDEDLRRRARREAIYAATGEIARAHPGGDHLSHSDTYDGPTRTTLFEIRQHGGPTQRYRIAVTVEEIENEDAGTFDATTTAPAPLGPPWQLRDVVRDADTDHAEDVWVYLPDGADDDVPWKSLDDGEWLGRDGLPENLTLLVRNGQPVNH